MSGGGVSFLGKALEERLQRWVRSELPDRRLLNEADLLWGPYQFEELVKSDPRCSIANPLFDQGDQLGIGAGLVAGRG
jgi:hypothetical protein